MLLINELKKLRHDLLNNSSLSLKERAFYQFLVGAPLNYPTGNDLAEIEQICLSVFSGDLLSKKELITAQRKKHPIHGMHYTTNLIDLSAMAIDNVELEQQNLKSYCKKCSTRDFYILNNLFPDISSSVPQPERVIDQIALHLHESNFPQKGWKPLLLNALYETSDLIDFYLVEQGYQLAIDDNPIIHRTDDIIYVRDTLVQVVAKTERRVKFIIKLASGFFLILIFGELIRLIVVNWDRAEPILTVVEVLLRLLAGLFFILTGFVPDKIEFFNSLTEKIINWVFKRKGLNRLELKETLDQLANQNEK